MKFLDLPQRPGNGLGIIAGEPRKIDNFRTFIRDAQPSSGVDKMYLVSIGNKLLDQLRQSLHGQREWSNIGDLRADVQAGAGHVEIFVGGCAAVKLRSSSNRNAEFMLMQACRDIGMGL